MKIFEKNFNEVCFRPAEGPFGSKKKALLMFTGGICIAFLIIVIIVGVAVGTATRS